MNEITMPLANSVRSNNPAPVFLSEAECADVFRRLQRAATADGYIGVGIASDRVGNTRWARNQVSTGGDVHSTVLTLHRIVRGAAAPPLTLTGISDDTLASAMAHVERMTQEVAESFVPEDFPSLTARYAREQGTLTPSATLFDEATAALDDGKRADAAQPFLRAASDAGMLSAGYIETAAHSRAFFDTHGTHWYLPWTFARCSVTVRDPSGAGSGWAGHDASSWSAIDTAALSKGALDKCLKSRNPVRVEPGRYTVILEPQAVADLMSPMMGYMSVETGDPGQNPFRLTPDTWALGTKIIDPRFTVRTDSADAELAYPPIVPYMWGAAEPGGQRIFPMTWITDGVLSDLSYLQPAAALGGRYRGQGTTSSFRVDVRGPTHTIEEMIATTQRGLLVTRFDRIMVLNQKSATMRGYTRDGVWLIENGKISHPVKNLVFTDSPLFALNKVDMIGAPRRVYHPPNEIFVRYLGAIPGPAGAIVPALKVNDFSFTALSDAV